MACLEDASDAAGRSECRGPSRSRVPRRDIAPFDLQRRDRGRARVAGVQGPAPGLDLGVEVAGGVQVAAAVLPGGDPDAHHLGGHADRLRELADLAPPDIAVEMDALLARVADAVSQADDVRSP